MPRSTALSSLALMLNSLPETGSTKSKYSRRRPPLRLWVKGLARSTYEASFVSVCRCRSMDQHRQPAKNLFTQAHHYKGDVTPRTLYPQEALQLLHKNLTLWYPSQQKKSKSYLDESWFISMKNLSRPHQLRFKKNHWHYWSSTDFGKLKEWRI